jgi:rhomboid protease GluP
VLEVSTDVLIDFGAALGTLVQEGQVWRLLSAGFLHVNLLHILMNTVSLLIFLTRFEKIYPLHTPVILVVSSVTGTHQIIQASC